MFKREYNALRNLVDDQVRVSKRNYLKYWFSNIRADINKTWSTSNSILRGSSKKKQI